MTGITYFGAVAFDYGDDAVVAGEPIGCPSPAAAIQRAQGLWKTLVTQVQLQSAGLAILRLANSVPSKSFGDSDKCQPNMDDRTGSCARTAAPSGPPTRTALARWRDRSSTQPLNHPAVDGGWMKPLSEVHL